MNKRPYSTWVSRVAVALLALSAVPASVRAQPAPVESSSRKVELDLEFPGGTLAEFLDLVRDQSASGHVNIVLGGPAGAASRVRVPALSLRAVSLEIAFRAVESVASSQPYEVRIRDLSGRDGSPVFVAQFAERRTPPQLRILSLEPALGDDADAGEREATLLSAISAALSLLTDSDEGVALESLVRYHAESGLLFVRADDSAVVEAVETIVRELSARNELVDRAVALERAVVEKQAHAEQLRALLDDTSQRLAQAEQAAEFRAVQEEALRAEYQKTIERSRARQEATQDEQMRATRALQAMVEKLESENRALRERVKEGE